MCAYVCAWTRVDAQTLFPQESSSAALPEPQRWRMGRGEDKAPTPPGPPAAPRLPPPAASAQAWGGPVSAPRRRYAGAQVPGGGGGGRLVLVGPSPGELCGPGRRARRFLSGVARSAAGGAGLSVPRPPGDPLLAVGMRGVSTEGGESRRGPGSQRTREGRRGGPGGGRKDAEEEEDGEGQALS